jgi:hypothetical protein
MIKEFEEIKPTLSRLQNRALAIGIAGIAVSLAGLYMDKGQFFQSYLLGYLFWIGPTVASIALVGLHHLTAGGWGFSIQRILESASRTFPVMALLFVPFIFGMKDLFIWARPEVLAADTLLQHKAAYLNVPFFWLRAAAYFGLWALFIYKLTGWSFQMDRTGDLSTLNKFQKFGGPAILVYMLTMTFASFDWGMSLDPHWFSTIFGFMFVIGQVLLTMSIAIIVLRKVVAAKPLGEVVQKSHFHDLGNLMLAFVALWAYISFSQFLIIWSGNLPEEIPWYIHRMEHGWDKLGIAIALFHFMVPFAVLLSRQSKRNIEMLSKVAIWMVVMRFLDLVWIIVPNFHHEHFVVHWLDFSATVGIGGVWAWFFLRQLKSRSLLPTRDPRVEEAFAHESH